MFAVKMVWRLEHICLRYHFTLSMKVLRLLSRLWDTSGVAELVLNMGVCMFSRRRQLYVSLLLGGSARNMRQREQQGDTLSLGMESEARSSIIRSSVSIYPVSSPLLFR